MYCENCQCEVIVHEKVRLVDKDPDRYEIFDYCELCGKEINFGSD